MSAIGITQASRLIVVFGKEEGSVRAFRGVLAEEAVDGTQELLKLVDRHGALATQIGLKVGHEERGSDALSRDVTDDEAEAVATKREEIVIISADLKGLQAASGVIQGS